MIFQSNQLKFLGKFPAGSENISFLIPIAGTYQINGITEDDISLTITHNDNPDFVVKDGINIFDSLKIQDAPILIQNGTIKFQFLDTSHVIVRGNGSVNNNLLKDAIEKYIEQTGNSSINIDTLIFRGNGSFEFPRMDSLMIML